MRIRRNPLRMLGLSFCATVPAQPKAPPSEAPVLSPPAPASPASDIDTRTALVLPAAAPREVCLQNCAWTLYPRMLNPEEQLKDGLGDALREPRENPGLASKIVKFVLRQEEVETKAVVEKEIFLLKRKVKVNIGKQKQQQEEEVNEKLKRDGSQQKKGCSNKKVIKKMMAKVIKKEVVTTAHEPLPQCKRSDGRKWRCGKDAVVPHTLCEKHLLQSRLSYNSRKEAHGSSSKKSASQKALALSSSEADPWKASSSSKRARRTSTAAPSSSFGIGGAALASDAPASSKAAPPPSTTAARPISSKRPLKEEVDDDYSGGAFYYAEPFGPFRGKQQQQPCGSSYCQQR